MTSDELAYGPGGTAERFPAGTRPLATGDELLDCLGQRVDDVEGKRLGVLHAVLVARGDGASRFALVRDRAGNQRAVPVAGMLAGGGRVWTPFAKALVERGPHLSDHGAVSARAENDLARLFGLPPGPNARTARWERRATLSAASRAPDDPRTVRWRPGPRSLDERRSGLDRRTGEIAAGLDPAPAEAPAVAAEELPRLPGGLPDRRRSAGRRFTDG